MNSVSAIVWLISKDCGTATFWDEMKNWFKRISNSEILMNCLYTITFLLLSLNIIYCREQDLGNDLRQVRNLSDEHQIVAGSACPLSLNLFPSNFERPQEVVFSRQLNFTHKHRNLYSDTERSYWVSRIL